MVTKDFPGFRQVLRFPPPLTTDNSNFSHTHKKTTAVGIKNDKVSFVLRKSVFLFRGLHMMFFHVSKG